MEPPEVILVFLAAFLSDALWVLNVKTTIRNSVPAASLLSGLSQAAVLGTVWFVVTQRFAWDFVAAITGAVAGTAASMWFARKYLEKE